MAYDQALCSLCGSAHGTRARERIKGRTGRTIYRFGVENWWTRLLQEWEMDKPFGVTQKANGRGKPMDIEYWDIDDPRAEPFIAPMRELLLLNIQRALKQGLISKEEVGAILEDSEV